MLNQQGRNSLKTDAGGRQRCSDGEEMGTTVMKHLLPENLVTNATQNIVAVGQNVATESSVIIATKRKSDISDDDDDGLHPKSVER